MATKLITREGYNKLKQEHDYLWNEKRPEITKIVSWAASLGDRSENADYTFNKRILRQIDRRVHFLRKLMPQLQIVGPEEIYGERKDYISIDSPMARAILKKQVDEEFVVKTPEGEKMWFVNSIRYEKGEGQ